MKYSARQGVLCCRRPEQYRVRQFHRTNEFEWNAMHVATLDQTKCLKCQSELKKRSSLQERRGVAFSNARSLRISATPPGTPTPTRLRSQSLPTSGVDNTQDTLRHDKGTSSENDVDVCIGSGDIQKLVLSSIPSPYRKMKSTGKHGMQISLNGHRISMNCIECGSQCLPHGFNDVAHCFKSQAVPKRRPNAYRAKPLAAGLTRSHQRRTWSL